MPILWFVCIGFPHRYAVFPMPARRFALLPAASFRLSRLLSCLFTSRSWCAAMARFVLPNGPCCKASGPVLRCQTACFARWLASALQPFGHQAVRHMAPRCINCLHNACFDLPVMVFYFVNIHHFLKLHVDIMILFVYLQKICCARVYKASSHYSRFHYLCKIRASESRMCHIARQ